MKSLIAAALLVIAPFAQAGAFSSWDLNGSSSLVNSGDTIRLTDGAGADTGTAWMPGTIDLSTFNAASVLTIEFDYKATAGGDALALVLTSGGGMSPSPTGYLGLTGIDDGLLMALKPGSHAAGSVVLPYTPVAGLPATVAERVNGFADTRNENGNMLADPEGGGGAMHARFQIKYEASYNRWVYQLSVAQPSSASFIKVASAQSTTLASIFDDLGSVNIGFVASSTGAPATFDVVKFTVNVPVTPAPVPEPGTAVMGLLALMFAAGLAYRRR
ncbi:MAG: PEP-CTERM sorting domain-containing protein [Rubrivivax sp.]|nr:MAG: PEP-CTERM sorting domain-containing protein [Rubrivivax sp.]